MSKNNSLVAAKVYINRRFYTVKCTMNQLETVTRMGQRAKDNPTASNVKDYETLVKLLLNRHKQRKQEIEVAAPKFWD